MDLDSVWMVFGLILFLAMIGVPVAFCLIFSSGIGLLLAYRAWGPAVSTIQQTALYGVMDYNFVVIPLFTAMGLLITSCGAADDLFNVINRRLSRVPGRLAVATICGNAVFAAVTGVGLAAAAAFSQVAYPAMRQHKYSRSFSTGCIAGSSVLGLLIPPSVLLIVWALLTEQSVGKLFAAAVLPGIVLSLFFLLYVILRALIDPRIAPNAPSDVSDRETPVSGPGNWSEFIGWFGVTILIIVTLGSIWGGIATPTEGSALGFLGAAILARAKGVGWRGQFEAIFNAGKIVAPIMFLIIAASMYAKFLTIEGVPDLVRMAMSDVGLGAEGSLLVMVAIWLILGCMVDSISIMLLTVPIFWPIAASLNFDPIAFALIGVLVIEAGILTPPFGIGAFVVKAAVPDPSIKLNEVFIGAVPYWLLILLVAYLIYVFPPLTQLLPDLI